MSRDPHISLRDPDRDYVDPINSIVAATTSRRRRVTAADVIRQLLDESLTPRAHACAAGHVGPVRDGACGNCGGWRPTP